MTVPPSPRAPALGTALPRREDAALLRGRGRFTDDLPSPGARHLAILRSPHAHARIRAVDVDHARARPDVAGVWTGAALSEVLRPFPSVLADAPPYPAIAIDRVRYVGEPVAVVLADDRYAAEDALEDIAVDYEVLPAVIDPPAAMAADAPVLHPAAGGNMLWSRTYRYGDPDGAFEVADRIVDVDVRFPKYNSTPLETYAVQAEWDDASGTLTLRCNFQGPFSLHAVLCRALGLAEHELRLITAPEIGGSFGIKAMIYPYLAIAGACARASGLPVRWTEDRVEHLAASASGTDRVSRAQAAVRADGKILAVRVSLTDNVGAYLRAPEPSCVMRSLTTFSGPYDIAHGEIEARVVVTNKAPTGLNRGYGGQQHIFTLERLVDAVARALRLDPAEVRFRNFVAASAFPRQATTGSYYDSGDYTAALRVALAEAGYDAMRAEDERGASDEVTPADDPPGDSHRPRPRPWRGIGICTAIHSSAANMGYVTLALDPAARADPRYRAKSGNQDWASIKVDPSGRVVVEIATAGAGQGHRTTAAQIAAAELGIDIASVSVLDEVDTARTPWSVGTGSYSSRWSVVVGSAIALAARRLKQNLLAVAAHALEAAPGDIEWIDGEARVKGSPARSMRLRQIAGLVHWSGGELPADLPAELQATAVFRPPHMAPPDAADRINAASAYGFMADVAVVEIDPETLIARVVKYVAVHDVGRALNPLLVRGQIHGGILNGIAGALYEELVYDEDGQLRNGTFADYLCPTAAEMPTAVIVRHVDVPSPFNPLGVKGCGENSAMSAPAAVAAAIENALRHRGVRVDALPATPARLWTWLRQAPSAPAEAPA